MYVHISKDTYYCSKLEDAPYATHTASISLELHTLELRFR